MQERVQVVFKNGQKWAYDPTKRQRDALSRSLLSERQQLKIFAPYKGPLSVKASFFCQSHGERKKDLDNLCKALLDSGNTILWKDDNQIEHLELWKHKCEVSQERTELEVREL